jgi:hypothetical protein
MTTPAFATRFYVTYDFEGSPLTLRHCANDLETARALANASVNKKNSPFSKVLRVSPLSPRPPRSYYSSVSSIAMSMTSSGRSTKASSL